MCVGILVIFFFHSIFFRIEFMFVGRAKECIDYEERTKRRRRRTRRLVDQK